MKRVALALTCAVSLLAVGCSGGEVTEGGALEKQKEIQEATDAGIKKDAQSEKSDRE